MKTTVYTAIIGYLCATARRWANDLYLNPPELPETVYSGRRSASFSSLSATQAAVAAKHYAPPPWCREIV